MRLLSLSASIILVLMFLVSKVETMETAVSRNVLNFNVNQLASEQKSRCHESNSLAIHISADQFEGNGTLKEIDTEEDVQQPESYFKIYGSDTISVTTFLPSDQYQLELLGRHAQPGPVILQVWANQLPVGTLRYARNDNSWEKQCMKISSSYWFDQQNYLVISVRFANDGGPQGARDASVAWLRLR
jgi:hypothetical protein